MKNDSVPGVCLSVFSVCLLHTAWKDRTCHGKGKKMNRSRRDQFLPGGDGSVRLAGRQFDAQHLAQELSVFPELQAAVQANDIERVRGLVSSVRDAEEKKKLLNMADKEGFS